MKPRRLPPFLLLAAGTTAGVAALVLGACVGDDPSAAGAAVDSGSESGVEGSAADAGIGSADGTSPDDAATDADAGPWTPARLDEADNLALWLEPSAANFVISSSTVAIWKDRSKNKNDAKNPSGGPTVHAALLNGHDTVHFDMNVVLSIDDAPTLRFATEQFYVAAVARLIPAQGVGYLFSKAASTPTSGGSSYAGGFEFWAGPGTTDAGATAVLPSARVAAGSGNRLDWGDAVFDDSKFHFVAARRINGFNLALSVDDQPDRTATTGTFDADEIGKTVHLGAWRYGTYDPAVDFDIAELIVVHGPSAIVSDADVANVHAYLKKKYAL